jgi:hypothetical protein
LQLFLPGRRRQVQTRVCLQERAERAGLIHRNSRFKECQPAPGSWRWIDSRAPAFGELFGLRFFWIQAKLYAIYKWRSGGFGGIPGRRVGDGPKGSPKFEGLRAGMDAAMEVVRRSRSIRAAPTP